jgi:hypothetical protein
MIAFGSFEAVRFRVKGRPLQRATLVFLPLAYLHLAFRQIRGFVVRAVMVASFTKKLNDWRDGGDRLAGRAEAARQCDSVQTSLTG